MGFPQYASVNLGSTLGSGLQKPDWESCDGCVDLALEADSEPRSTHEQRERWNSLTGNLSYRGTHPQAGRQRETKTRPRCQQEI